MSIVCMDGCQFIIIAHFCLTEESAGIHEGVNILPLPDTDYEGWWIKLMLFQRDFGLRGRIIYLTGCNMNIDFLAEDNAGLSIIENGLEITEQFSNEFYDRFIISGMGGISGSFYEDVKVKIEVIRRDFSLYSSAHTIQKRKSFYKKSCMPGING